MIQLTDKEFHKLSAYIETHCGIHLKEEKRTLLSGRLSNLLLELGINDFTEYYSYLQYDPKGEKLSNLLDKVTTNHTYFMRESDHFAYLQSDVLPWLKATVKDRDLRVWCGASSSGEEPYTLAMLLNEFFRGEVPVWDKRLLATDISLEILNMAFKGIYPAKEASTLPKTWVQNYFDKIDGDNLQVKESLKKQVIFRRFNLLEENYPFKKPFHVIFLRNVMIYFDMQTKEKLLGKLYDQLVYGGYLFIGHSETINRNTSRFQYIRPAVYRKMR